MKYKKSWHSNESSEDEPSTSNSKLQERGHVFKELLREPVINYLYQLSQNWWILHCVKTRWS